MQTNAIIPAKIHLHILTNFNITSFCVIWNKLLTTQFLSSWTSGGDWWEELEGTRLEQLDEIVGELIQPKDYTQR